MCNTSSAGTRLQLDFSITFDQQLTFKLEGSSQWLGICCYSGVPGLSTGPLNLI